MNPTALSASSVPVENYFDLLNLLGEVVVSTEDLDSVLRSTVRLIQRLISVQRCSILVMDESGNRLRLGAAAGIPEEIQAQIQVRVGEGVAGRVAETGQEIFQAETPAPAHELCSDPERYSTTSFISVPIRHQSHTLGVVNCTNKRDRASLDSNDLALLKSVSRFLALAMEKHRLRVETEVLHEHLERTVESLPVGLLTMRVNGEVLMVNPAASRMLGYLGGGAAGRTVFHCFPKQTAHCLAALRDATLRTPGRQEREVEVESRDGGPWRLPVRLTARLVSSPSDAAAELAILVEDLTLRREVQELRRLDELKSNFIAMVSHELRTPLTSIRGAEHLLSSYYKANLNETQGNLLKIVRTNTERLISLVNNILDVSLLDNQSLHLEFESMDLRRVLKDRLEGMQRTAAEKRIELEPEWPSEPVRVWGDSSRLTQVVGQVLDNAIKFTPIGGVVSAKIRIDGDHAILDVIDTGEGIPADLRDRVFERFFQGDTTLTRRSGGTGIGLYIARALTEAHGGAISVVESNGAGAHIRIRLPLETSPKSPKNRSRTAE